MHRVDRKRLIADINIPGGAHPGRIRFEIDAQDADKRHFEAAHELAAQMIRLLILDGGAAPEPAPPGERAIVAAGALYQALAGFLDSYTPTDVVEVLASVCEDRGLHVQAEKLRFKPTTFEQSLTDRYRKHGVASLLIVIADTYEGVGRTDIADKLRAIAKEAV